MTNSDLPILVKIRAKRARNHGFASRRTVFTWHLVSFCVPPVVSYGSVKLTVDERLLCAPQCPCYQTVETERFLPRDAMRKRGLCCRPVSVCLSVTLVDCIQTATDTVKLLSRPSSPIILVFDPSAGAQFQRELLQRGRKIQERWKIFAIFAWNRRLSWKPYDIGPWLLWNVNRKS